MSFETSVQIEIGFRGTVTGLSRSSLYQRGSFDVKDPSGRILASSSLIGSGENVSMVQEINSLPVWSFGPFTKVMTLTVLIEHGKTADGSFIASKLAPVTVRKEPDAVTPQTYIVTTVLSEDQTDNDFNDGIVSIFQYK